MRAGAFMATPALRAAEPRADDALQRRGDGFVADRVDGVVEERLDQQPLRLGARNAARHQVEELRLVDAAGRGAVAALDVVGEDLQLRLGRKLGRLRQEKRLRHHLGVGLLRVGLDDDAPLEHAFARRRRRRS